MSPSTSYTYQLTPVSFHGIPAPWSTPITVDTPSTNNIDPRRTGIKPLGSYWGASPEQIDMASGNLNLMVPVLQAQGRGGWTVPFSLSYNSQNWKKDSAGVERASLDVGYGQGWRMMAGSLTPYWNTQSLKIDHYLYVDSTGAEYRLYPMPSDPANIWTSQLYAGVSGEAVYVYYDSYTELLHFRDGSFWVMGCASSEEEQDAGTLYPTVIEDRNGNQVLISYEDGINTIYGNSSARIKTITDTRATFPSSYTFGYFAANSTGIPHLQSIANYLGTDEGYTFSYGSGPVTLTDPFGVGGSYPNVTELVSTTDQINFVSQFLYDGSGQLLTYELPNGGYLQWTYQTNTYSWSSPSTNQVSLQAVATRFLAPAAGASALLPTGAAGWSYNLAYQNYVQGESVMPNTCVSDVGAHSERCWGFNTGQAFQGQINVIGLASNIWRYNTTSGSVMMRNDQLGYWQDAAGNPYVSADTTMDYTGSATLYSQKTQALDQYGNVTQSSVWDWSTTMPNTSSGWTRQYNSTFQNVCSSPFTGSTSSNCSYVNQFLLGLLLTQTLTDSHGNQITLANNTYDGYTTHPLTAVSGLAEFDSSYNTAYLTRGNLTQSITPGATTNTYYDQTGMPTGADDNANPTPHAVSISMATGTNNSAPGVIQPNTGSSNDANLATSLTYSTFLGVASATPPNGSQTTTSYDTDGRPSTAVSATGASTAFTYAFGTTANGNIGNGAYTTTVTTNTHYVTTIADGLGRTASAMTGYSSTQVSEVDTAYAPCACSPAGKVSQVSQPYAPGGTAVYTKYAYDALGRTLTVTLPDNASKTTYAYLGNWTNVVDAAGKWKQYETDVFGNTIEVVEPDPNYIPLVTSPPATPGTGSGILITTYTYDYVNHLTNVGMTRGSTTQTRTSVYDPATLRLTSTTSPETGAPGSLSGTTSYTYNSDGTLYQRTDPKNQVTTYSYDSYQRVITVTHGTDATQTYHYTYDTGTYGYGRLTQVTWGGTCSGSVPIYKEAYSYTQAGEMSGKTLTVTKLVSGRCVQVPVTGGFAYDNEGKLTGITYPEFINGVTAPTATNTYDAMSRLVKVVDANELDVTACTGGAGSITWARGATYNAGGQLTGLQRLQSVSGCAPASPLYFNQAWTYNSLNQLTEIDTSAQSGGVPQGSTNPGTATYFFAKYAFSATGNNGQIQSMTDARTGNTVTYAYDLLKRVTTATATGGTAWGQTFGYDGFGNLTSKSVPAGSSEITLPGVNAQKNQLLGSTYDNNGNVLTLNNATLAYDVENRLTSYTASGGFVENYAYDEGNRRVEKWNSSGQGVSDNVYFYGPDGKLLSVLNVNITGSSPWFALSTSVNRIYFGGMVLGSSSGYATGDTNLLKDRLGSARPAYPYGTDISSGVSEGDDFATYWQDYHTGFEYAMNRYYSAGYGRFLTVDPFGGSAQAHDPGSWNRYAYTFGDPVNTKDPSGLTVCDANGDNCSDSVDVTDDGGDSDGEDSDVAWNVWRSSWFASGGQAKSHGNRPPVVVKDLQKNGKKYDKVAKTLHEILNTIDPDCLSFLQSGGSNLSSYVSGLLSSDMLAVGDVKGSTLAAFTGITGTDLPDGSAALVVNSNGAFFSSGYTLDNGRIQGGTPQADVFILLHELGHALDATGFQHDLGNKAAGNSNDLLIQQHCQKTIQGAQ